MIIVAISFWFLVIAGVLAIPLVVVTRGARLYKYIWGFYALVSVSLITHFFVRLHRLESTRFSEIRPDRDPQLDFYFSYPLVLPVAIVLFLYLCSGWGFPKLSHLPPERIPSS